MTDVSAGPVGFTFPGAEHKGPFLGLRVPQTIALGSGVLWAVTAMVMIPSGLGLLMGMLFAVAGAGVAFVSVAGRHLDEWAPVVGRWVLRRGERTWVTPVPLWGETAGSERSAPPPALRGVAFLSVQRHGVEALGVAKDRMSGTWSAALRCRGNSFALLDAPEQERLTGLWGQAIAGFAQEGSPVARLAWVERTIPEEGDALAAWLDEAGVLGPGDPAYDSYAELIASAGPVSQRHETYLVVTIDSARAKKAVRQAGGGDVGACEVLIREVDHLADRLRQADIDVAERLDARQLAAAIRAAFDPNDIRKLPVRERAWHRRGVAGRLAWPTATREAWDHYQSDSGFNASFHVAEWPRQRVAASFLHPLILRPRSQHAIAVVMEPIPPSRASRAVESAHASHIADEELRARAGYVETARRRRDYEELVRREEELARGHAECRFSGYVTVTGRSMDELEFAAGEIEQLGYDARIELRRMYGQQEDAFTYTLPLGRGLGRSRGR